MLQRGGQLGLPDESLPELRILGDLGRQKLERDATGQPEVLGQVHDSHPAPSKESFDAVPGEFRADPGVSGHACLVVSLQAA